MFDLKVINSVLSELETERGIPAEKIIEAIAASLATAYKKEYGKKGQIVRASFDISSGGVEFYQVKIVVDETRVRMEDEPEPEDGTLDDRVRFNPEHHILLADAKRIKKDAQLDDEIVFPLEAKSDFGRIAAQTAKQVIIQKLREAEKVSVLEEFGGRQGEVVTGSVQRMERGNIYVDLKRATGVLPYEEQIPGERYAQGERVRAYLYAVEDSPRGVFLKLSRSHPKFLAKLFEFETPEIKNGMVDIKAIAREAGSRSKVAVASKDAHIDPVGSLVGARGVRVATVTSELGGEKIDIIEWSEDAKKFIEDALSPAKILSVETDFENRRAVVTVSEDQQSLAIGRGGQNVRLAGKLTGWRIDIRSTGGEELAHTEGGAEADLDTPGESPEAITEEILEKGEDVAPTEPTAEDTGEAVKEDVKEEEK